MERFIEVDIYKYTGLSMTEFFDLPREYCLKIFEMVTKKQKKEDKLNESLTNQLQALTGR